MILLIYYLCTYNLFIEKLNININLFIFQPNPRKLMPGPPSGLSTENDGTIDPKNFATIRTTSIVQREQKEHLQEDMHDQMSGYKRLRRDHQAALSRYILNKCSNASFF